jgi:site-specific DNA-methyltransferase (adenine-specific)
VKINYGIKTGFNEAFIIDTATKERLCEQDPHSAEILKPILRGRDIKRYGYEWAGWWIINSHNGLKSAGIEPINVVNDYPDIYEYLQQFETQLRKRQDQGVHWTNLRNCAYLQEFEQEKVIWAEMTDGSCFSWDDTGVLINQTCYFIPNASKYLLCLLNSKVIYFYFSKIATSLGNGAFRWIKQFVEQVPIPKISKTEQQPFIALVDKILAAKERGEDTSELERWLDALVFDLYNLTEEEISIAMKNC